MHLIIVILNDVHRWTRNQIADWVETVEPAEEVEQGQGMGTGPQEEGEEKEVSE